MGEKDQPTSIRLSPRIKARVAAIKERSAVIGFRETGRRSRTDGWGYEELLCWGAERAEAEIARVWTAEHEALLGALPPPATLRGSPVPRVKDDAAAALLAEARKLGFGPDTPQDLKIAKAVELHDAGVTDRRIGELLGVSTNLVSWWRHRAAVSADMDEERLAAEALRLDSGGAKAADIARMLGVSYQRVSHWKRKARLGQARSRADGAGAVKHATPVKFQAPGRAS